MCSYRREMYDTPWGNVLGRYWTVLVALSRGGDRRDAHQNGQLHWLPVHA